MDSFKFGMGLCLCHHASPWTATMLLASFCLTLGQTHCCISLFLHQNPQKFTAAESHEKTSGPLDRPVLASRADDVCMRIRQVFGRIISIAVCIMGCHLSYCWWKKTCTSWYGKYPIIYRVLCISGGAGFLPSTVVIVTTTSIICFVCNTCSLQLLTMTGEEDKPQ